MHFKSIFPEESCLKFVLFITGKCVNYRRFQTLRGKGTEDLSPQCRLDMSVNGGHSHLLPFWEPDRIGYSLGRRVAEVSGFSGHWEVGSRIRLP